MGHWTRMGIDSFRAGNRQQAERFFRYALMEDPGDIRAWLWLVEVATDDAEKRHYLEEVLRLDPQHALARAALRELETRQKAAAMPHAAPFNLELPEHAPAAPSPAPALAPDSTDGRSQPPFVEGLMVRRVYPTDQPDPVSPAVPGWLWLALGLGIVVLVLVIFLAAGVLLAP
jgi:hypothetical protein